MGKKKNTSGEARISPLFLEHVKMSSFNIFASAIIIATWIRRITNPARSHIGALPTAPRSALEAIKAMTI